MVKSKIIYGKFEEVNGKIVTDVFLKYSLFGKMYLGRVIITDKALEKHIRSGGKTIPARTAFDFYLLRLGPILAALGEDPVNYISQNFVQKPFENYKSPITFDPKKINKYERETLEEILSNIVNDKNKNLLL